jgi:hypothetical protein
VTAEDGGLGSPCIFSLHIGSPPRQVRAIQRCSSAYQGSQWAAYRLFRLYPTSLLCFEQSLAEQPASAPDKPKAVAGTPEPQKSAQTTPGSGRLAMAPPLRPASRPRESPVASTSASVSSPLNPIPPNKHSLGPDSSPRPPKRVRMSTDETPSLLSRLGSSASKGTDYRPIVARPANAVPKNPPPGVAVMDSGQTPQGGYSIKGAARAINEPRRTSSTGSTSSLLERLNGGVGGVGGGRSDDDRARRKNW